jgi:3-hydroxyisobutyrate dehydrogenase-like beta-hydroxyacid dehydrogenase
MDAGLIGIGQMGSGIAKSLLLKGHRLTIYNRTASRAETLRALGAQVAASVSEACGSGVVLTMLADDAALESVVYGEKGVLASLPVGGLHISLSTIGVALSDRLAADHTRARQEFVAAPVFGRPEAAASGSLVIVAAGPNASIERAKPLLAAMGPRLVTFGDRPSLANVVKLSGNFLLCSVLESLAEAMAFARKQGIEPAALCDLLTSTFFNAPVYKMYGGLIVAGKYEPAGFATKLGFKDVRLVLQAAEAAAVPMPVASLVHDRLMTAIARGNAEKDWSVLGRIADQDAGLPPIR